MSAEQRQVTDASAFQNRSLGKQVLFAVITFGLYTLYWYWITLKQLSEGTDADYNPVVRFVLAFIPIVNLLVFWWFANDSEAVVEQDSIVIFIAELFFPPIVWYLVQSGINDAADGTTA